MRLLSLKTPGLSTFCTFTEDPPPYAILSHTWRDEEVTYSDIQADTGRQKQGFAKVEFCARQAEEDGLEFIWVDIC